MIPPTRLCNCSHLPFEKEANYGVVNFAGSCFLSLLRNLFSCRKLLSEEVLRKIAKSSPSLLIFFTAIVVIFQQSSLHAATASAKKIAIIGTGYVGLVIGAGLADFGNEVICADIDSSKIDLLNRLIIPIYEPGLEALVIKGVENNKLAFTDNLKLAIQSSDVIFICVGTPTDEKGHTDIRAVESVAKEIGNHLNGYKLICTKSTVPVGTAKKIAAIIRKNTNFPFDMASNPEFLREGSAVEDFFHPERTVIGVESKKGKQLLLDIYSPFAESGSPFVFTKNLESAETIKYASNAFLAVKVSFINEMANFCDAVGADVEDVSIGMGLDKRISPYFLKPGPGFGGSCFPKDTAALSTHAQELDVSLSVVNAAMEANKHQREIAFSKLKQLCDDSLQDKTIAILGLSFKAETDDIRESPAIFMIEKILQEGGVVRAFDPVAIANMQRLYPAITYGSSIHETVYNADALVLLTDWNEFKSLALKELEVLMHKKIILDTRNILDPIRLQKNGWEFSNFGRTLNQVIND